MAKKRRRRSEWFTEDVWLTCKDQYSFADGLQGLVLDGCSWLTDRKVQLFEVACARRIAHLLPSELCRRTIDLAEVAADAPGGPLAVSPLPVYAEISAELDPYGPAPDYLPRPPLDALTSSSLELAANLASPEQLGARVRYMVGNWAVDVAAIAAGVPGSDAEVASQLPLLYDVFGNPFRPGVFSHSWRTDTTESLARQMYDARDFTAMPILAEALEDVGCDSEAILNHCRAPGPHVRGCWVVDLVLGKE